jgi:hypothetical protein
MNLFTVGKRYGYAINVDTIYQHVPIGSANSLSKRCYNVCGTG